MGTKRRDYLWYGFAALVNKAPHKTDLLLDLEPLAAMADRLTGAQPGLLVAVGDATPTEFPADTLLTEIIPAGKGLLADHRFYSAQQLEGMTLSGLASRSGVLRPMTDRDCPVDLAKKEMLTLHRQSCGKCTFCREGLYQLNEIFERISLGRAKAGDLDLAEEIGRAMTISCNCTLGEEATLPALSAMDAFAAETQAHVRRKECAANACLALTQFYVDPQLCNGCGKCLPACPVPVKGTAPAAQAESEAAPLPAAKRKRVFARPAKPQAVPVETPAAPVNQSKHVEVNIMKTIETDIVIVAGGPAGLAAAIAAGEQGMKTVILEKSSATGGAANMGMGPLGIDTKIQKAAFNNLGVDKAIQMHMEYTHYRMDEDLVQAYFHKSADTIEWL